MFSPFSGALLQVYSYISHEENPKSPDFLDETGHNTANPLTFHKNSIDSS